MPELMFCAKCHRTFDATGDLKPCACGGTWFRAVGTTKLRFSDGTIRTERPLVWTERDKEFLKVTRISPE